MHRMQVAVVAAFFCILSFGCGTTALLGTPKSPRQMFEYGIELEQAGSLVAAYNLFVEAINGPDAMLSKEALGHVQSSPALLDMADRSVNPTLENLVSLRPKQDAVSIVLVQSDSRALQRIKGASDDEMRLFLASRFDKVALSRKNDADRIAASERQKAELEANERAEKRKRAQQLEAQIRAGTNFTCRDDLECRKAFALAQIYVNTHSDMKIQIATDTIVETHNPTGGHKLGLRITKLPLSGQASEITIDAICEGCSTSVLAALENPTALRALRIRADFRQFIVERLR